MSVITISFDIYKKEMASRTDIQQHFGRVQADSVKLAGALAPMGEWVAASAPILGATLGAGASSIVRYTVIGKTCIATYQIVQSGAGTASGSLNVFLPLQARSGSSGLSGHGVLTATSGTAIVSTSPNGVDRVLLFATTNAAGPSLISDTVFGIDDNAAWNLQFTVTYEIA
jgi:hypothetical protein